MAARDLDEVGIASGGPDGEGVADEAKDQAGDPHAKAQAQGGGQGSVEDGERPRRPGQQDWLGQRAMEGGYQVDDGRRLGIGVECHLDQGPAAKRKEAEEEGRGGEGDGQAEDDLDAAAHDAGRVAEGPHQAGDGDSDDPGDLGYRTCDRIQDGLQRCFPGHVGACRQGRLDEGQAQNGHGQQPLRITVGQAKHRFSFQGFRKGRGEEDSCRRGQGPRRPPVH